MTTKATGPQFYNMKRKALSIDAAMKQSMDRVKELYPDDRNFAVSGAIGNDKQYSEHLESNNEYTNG